MKMENGGIEDERNDVPVVDVIDLETASESTSHSGSDDEEGKDDMADVKSEGSVIVVDEYDHDSDIEIVVPPEMTIRTYPMACKDENTPALQLKEEGQMAISEILGSPSSPLLSLSSATTGQYYRCYYQYHYYLIIFDRIWDLDNVCTENTGEPSSSKRSRILRSEKRHWTVKEINALMKLVEKNPGDWEKISRILHRTASACTRFIFL